MQQNDDISIKFRTKKQWWKLLQDKRDAILKKRKENAAEERRTQTQVHETTVTLVPMQSMSQNPSVTPANQESVMNQDLMMAQTQ